MKRALLVFCVIVISAFVLTSCHSQRRAAKKIDRLLKEYPELAIAETVRVMVPIYRPAINFDTNMPFVFGKPFSVTEPSTGIALVGTVFPGLTQPDASTMPGNEPRPNIPEGPYLNLQMLRPDGIDSVSAPVPKYILKAQKEPAIIRYTEAVLAFLFGLLIGFILKKLR